MLEQNKNASSTCTFRLDNLSKLRGDQRIFFIVSLYHGPTCYASIGLDTMVAREFRMKQI